MDQFRVTSVVLRSAISVIGWSLKLKDAILQIHKKIKVKYFLK